MKKNLLLFVGIMLLTLLFSTSSIAVPSFRVQVDERTLEFDVSPFIANGEPMVPVRRLAETIGARVEWDAKQKTAWIHKDMMHLEIPIDKTEFYIHRDADFSGIPQTVKLTAPVKTISGRTFLPAIVLAESLGITASWDINTNIFKVTTDKNASNGKVAWVRMNSTTVKTMELYSLDQEKLRNCSESEISAVIESFNQAAIDDNAYIQMITGRVLKVSLSDGRDITFTSYGSKTNVVAAIRMGDESKTYHLIVPAIAKILLQVN